MSNYLFDVEEFEEDAPLVSGSVNCDSGTQGECRFVCGAQDVGFHAYMPMGHSTVADVIVVKPMSRPLTVQVKKGVFQKKGEFWKSVIGATRSTCFINPESQKQKYRKYQRGEFDVFAMWIKEHDGFSLWTLDELVEKGSCSLRWNTGDRLNNWQLLNDLITK